MSRSLVLNATYEPINVCTVRRAVVLLLKEKAAVLEHGGYVLHSGSSTVPRPMVTRRELETSVPPACRWGPFVQHPPPTPGCW